MYSVEGLKICNERGFAKILWKFLGGVSADISCGLHT